MRGTIAFERLSYSTLSQGYGQKPRAATYMRIRLNDVVYPVVGCKNGPSSSCPLSEYQQIVKKKLDQAGDFKKLCNITDPAVPSGR